MLTGDDPGLEQLVREANQEALTGKWLDAVRLCEQALALVDIARDLPSHANLTELLATFRFKECFWSKSRDDFERKMSVVEALYETAAAEFERASVLGRSKRAKARGLFAHFWLTKHSNERGKILQKCIELSQESASPQELPEKKLLAETRLDLAIYQYEAAFLATDSNTRTLAFHEALKHGRLAIEGFRDLKDDLRLLESLRQTARLIAIHGQSEPSELNEARQEADRFGKEIAALSDKIGTTYALQSAKEDLGNIAYNLEGSLVKALSLYEQAASAPPGTYDSLELGRLFSELASVSDWLGVSEPGRERRQEILLAGLRYAESGIASLEIPYHTSLLASTHASHAECLIALANSVETEVEKKRSYLSRAVETATIGSSHEHGTLTWQLVAHALSKSTYGIATLTKNPSERVKLLGETLSTREEILRATDSLLPRFLWSRGVMRNYLALVKVELSDLEQSPKMRETLLRDASSLMQECIDLCGVQASSPSFIRSLAQYAESHGDALRKLHFLDETQETAQKALKQYEYAISCNVKSGHPAFVPAIRWKTAKILDIIGDFRGASDAFAKASEEYLQSGRGIAGLSSTYEELATYMQAWAEIEKARLYHAEEEYNLSYENYANASKHLSATKTWNHLSKLVGARSLLEKGEALSSQEKHSASIELFSNALRSFQDAEKALEPMKDSAVERNRQEIEDWLTVARQRQAFAQCRLELEEARALDKEGEKKTSARKYESASAMFKALAAKTSSESERREMETLASFCEAWACMKRAESTSSPELFAEAAQQLIKAKETSKNQSLRLLALANASICQALESGTRFRQTRDTQLYSEVKTRLETAADYFLEAGFKRTGTWTKATQRLFDALVILADAETERNLKKKAELYQMAERHFELAAKLYGEAGFPAKKREALEHLERTREEKEVLLAPLEALAELPTISTAHLASIGLPRSQAPGLERFEDANVVGETRPEQKELTVGAETAIGIDLVNVGKTPATLIKLENAIPEGFELVSKEAQQLLAGQTLDLRGKRLEYLNTHGVKLTLRAVRRGTADVAPRVIYVDDKGNYRSQLLRADIITVRESGVSEGAVAPPVIRIPAEFRFEDERSREVFHYLVKEFLDDYMSRRIFLEKAGWRSFMEVIKNHKLPRSAFYRPEGRSGPVLTELERRGLVETRIFPKERGRGGDVKKVRVAYENAVVKRIVEQAVMENA